MAKHSSGPWNVSEKRCKVGTVAIRSADGDTVAIVDKPRHSDRLIAQSAADAQLLASAPELAQRLGEALDLLIGTAGWLGLPADKQPDHAQVVAKLWEWVSKKGQPALDQAHGK